MAAATVTGSLFSNPKYPRVNPAGETWDYGSETIATTSLDDAGDRVKILPMAGNRKILFLIIENADLDSGAGALDADIVLNHDSADVILYNAGTAFAGALTGNSAIKLPLSQDITAVDNDASLDFYVNTPASTDQAGVVSLWVLHNSLGAF